MGYGSYLEKRKFGTYYFRQTAEVNGKQVVRRVSLRTKDIHVAKFLALQMKAKAAMVDPKNVRRYEVEWDENNQLKRVKVADDADARNLAELMKLVELHRAEAHRRELATKQFEAEQAAKTNAAFAESDEGKELRALHRRLEDTLPEKQNKAIAASPRAASGADLDSLLKKYLAKLEVKSGTLYKYRTFVEKFIAFAKSQGVDSAHGIDRLLVGDYLLHLKNSEHKPGPD